MAPAVAPAADHATDLLQKLTLDPKSAAGDGKEAKKKVLAPANGGLNGAVASQNPQALSAEQWATMGQQDYKNAAAAMYYGADGYPYYYGGWGDYSVYVSHDGTESLTPGAYGDMYCYPQYGAAASGYDGQYYGSQNNQYQSTYHQPQTTTGKTAYKSKTGKSEPSPQQDVVSAAYQQPGSVDASKANSNSTDAVKGLKKPTFPLKPSGRSTSYQNYGDKAAYPLSGSHVFLDKTQKPSAGNPTSTASNPKTKGLLGPNSTMGPASTGYMSSMYSGSAMYNPNAYGPGFWYGSPLYGSGVYGGWNGLSDGRYKPRGKAYGPYRFGNENIDGLNELKRGPRSNLIKTEQVTGAADVAAAKGQELPNGDASKAVVLDQYNKADFVETYSDAKFFVIKSYSEDDVHKSIKYNVWASTPNGNKKLNTAYQAAKDKSSNSPVFLFFSVNTSGQFVGLAEMVGPVDFDKTVEYWQQDKWTGCFPVKWHIVKDIPNNLLKHIILEYNENKPVTNSRDTQEVKIEHGLQVLKIFKDHVCKTSMLDDFGFYDNREKIMQEKKSKRQQPLEKITNGKLLATSNTENQDVDGKQGVQELAVLGEQNAVVENSVATVAGNGVAPADATPAVVAVGC
ncbi:YTH domain-containing protein ECT4-like isoform X2 [Lolium rigidum]|uniref:YTH domain-containing protein ECT4-like isoform X2 n=1 Tax=Lolium rigidum TaxID=89674 RepID=UPI001F5D2412|nr:YTH domain-containing protein ECT4-like isoform X2 [Lolium rigidum]